MSAVKIICEVMNDFETTIKKFVSDILGELEAVKDRSLSVVLKNSVSICVDAVVGSNDANWHGDQLDDLWDELILVKEYCWEQLNIGHWKQVPVIWRRTYSFISLLKVILLLRKAEPDIREAIKECDLGLLLGEPILDNVLSRIAFRLHLVAGQAAKNEDGRDEKNGKIWEEANIVNEDEYHKKAQKILPHHYDGRFDIDLALRPPIETFVEEYFHRQNPVLMSGVLERWPALSKWSVEYIRKRAGERTVPIEIGSKYTADEWTQKLVTMETFIKEYVESSADEAKKGYLAQHQLFHQIPELMEDVEIPEYCYVGSSHHVEINAWFGPAGTISPTHYDAKHNILTQVFGSKVIRLFRPQDWELLYPYGGEILFNTSQIDVEDPELPKKFPAAVGAKYTDVLLEPGMALYIPPKWAHYVKSLAPSFSISFWFE